MTAAPRWSVLRHLRAGLAPKARAHLPTDLCRREAFTDTTRIGDARAATRAGVHVCSTD